MKSNTDPQDTPAWRRVLDIAFSTGLLLITSPISIATAIAVASDGGPVLYRQTRAGLMGRRFEALKFRSMRVNNVSTAEMMAVHGQITNAHPDVTFVGKIIRRVKIDELPQLINILLGDMSLIGPRPTVMEQVVEYTPYQFRRLHIRPGLTGWSQVNGGIEFTWPERIVLDVWYVAHRSLLLDAKIFLMTFGVIVFGERPNVSALLVAEAYAKKELGVEELVWPQPEDPFRERAKLGAKVRAAARRVERTES